MQPQPAWAPPPQPERRRTGLLVALILVVVLLLVAALTGIGVYLYRAYGNSTLPSGLASAGFRVSDPSAREEVGKLLVGRLGPNARYAVRPNGVLIGVPRAERGTLTTLAAATPMRTEVSLNAVLSTGSGSSPSPAPSPGRTLPSQSGKESYTVGPAVLTGTQVKSVESHNDSTVGGRVVIVTFNSAGSKQLATFTEQQVGKRLAIVTVGVVVSAPTVQAPITGGAVQISGLRSEAEADGIVAAFQLGQRPVTISAGDPG